MSGRDTLAGWGRVPVVPGVELRSEDLAALTARLPLTRGLGRAYGDAALPAPGDLQVAGSRLADRILSFDDVSGVLRAEAGLSVAQICDTFLARRWFTPVTPGTRAVTLGGMVAADVHGKNHHRDGSFGQHVHSIMLRVGRSGDIVTCSPTEHPDLFRATIGGMGLTGHILEVTVRLMRIPSPWVVQETVAIRDLDHFVIALRESSATWPMTVGWIDCLSTGTALGRGILFRGRWAEAIEAPQTTPRSGSTIPVPFTPPSGLLRPLAMRLFNEAYFRFHRRAAGRRIVDPYAFFYPLDTVADWNRLYGSRGFIQYQCVVPEVDAVRGFLRQVAAAGRASFLCVIKDCGAEGTGMLSFPRPGISVAIDMPFGADTQTLVDAMNERVIAAGGRIYLAKDALTRADHYRAMDPRVDGFLHTRREWDPDGSIRSALSVRLFGW